MDVVSSHAGQVFPRERDERGAAGQPSLTCA